MADKSPLFKILKAEQRDLADLDAYPILTEEVGYPPSPLAKSTGAPPSGPGGGSLGQIAAKAVADVLGWKLKDGDAKGFIGALTQSFTLTEVEGHTESKWTPRTYAVQTDLSGGITGAQASIYTRAKEALDASLPLLDGLYALDPEADAEDVAALKAVAKGQLSEMVNELGMMGGPRISRVNQYFGLLLGAAYPSSGTVLNQTDPDQIGGTLGNLRDELGLNFTTQDFVNTVGDEQDLSNFRILADYTTSLAQSWLNNQSFFGLNTATPFYGTQLVLLSRQLSVVAESVDEVRFTLDSVFIGPAERQTLQLNFSGGQPAMFAEDLFTWIQSFASEEGPRLIQDGGKFAVQNTFVPVVTTLERLVKGITKPLNTGLPKGFFTPRVQRAMKQLDGELLELVNLASPIKHQVTPEPDFGLPLPPLAVFEVQPDVVSAPGPVLVQIIGAGFEGGATVTLSPGNLSSTVFFGSQSNLVAQLSGLTAGQSYSMTVTNPDHTPAVTLNNAVRAI